CSSDLDRRLPYDTIYRVDRCNDFLSEKHPSSQPCEHCTHSAAHQKKVWYLFLPEQTPPFDYQPLTMRYQKLPKRKIWAPGLHTCYKYLWLSPYLRLAHLLSTWYSEPHLLLKIHFPSIPNSDRL